MSLTIIAMTGILLGFLCLMVGFFMDGTESGPAGKDKRTHSSKKHMLHKKAV